jgi:hypothetical protein
VGLIDLRVTEVALRAAITEAVHEAGASRDCSDYVVPFGKRSSELANSGESGTSDAFRLLSILSAMRLDPDNPNDPFRPGMVIAESRTAIVDDLPEAVIDVIEQVASIPNDADLRARLCDICWLRRRNHQLAMEAVPAYIEAGKDILESDHSLHWAERFERGLQLAKSLKQDALQDVTESVLAELVFQQDSEAHVVAKAIELLLAYSRKVGREIADRANDMAERSDATLIWRTRFYDIAANCFRKAGLNDESLSAAINHAEILVLEADEALGRPHGGHAVAAQFVERAIQAFRRISGTESRRDELHRRLVKHQKNIQREMSSTPVGELDLSEHVLRARDEVAGKSFSEALKILALSGCSPDKAELRQNSVEQIRQYTFSFLWPSTTVSATGKTVAQHPGVSPSADEADESVILREMYSLARLQQQVAVVGRINPMRQLIVHEHAVRIHSFLEIVRFNPLIPQGREYIIARGLCAGMHGDFLVGLHLLIPQLEHAMRELLESRDAITSSLRPSGIQQEHLLGRLFIDFETELETIFGIDTVFDLRGLLIEQESCNFRNLLAHGMLPMEACYSSTAIYIWWIILRLVVIGHVRGHELRHEIRTES